MKMVINKKSKLTNKKIFEDFDVVNVNIAKHVEYKNIDFKATKLIFQQ